MNFKKWLGIGKRYDEKEKQNERPVYEAEPMNLEKRLDIVDQYTKKKKQEEECINKTKKQEYYELKEKVEKLYPRIKDLIILANRCQQLGVPLGNSKSKYGWGNPHSGFYSTLSIWYPRDVFIGFYDSDNIEYIVYETWHWIFYLNDHEFFIERRGNYCEMQKEFDMISHLSYSFELVLKQFDQFEKAFYAYIESLMCEQ